VFSKNIFQECRALSNDVIVNTQLTNKTANELYITIML
jgi:hypothetical protein